MIKAFIRSLTSKLTFAGINSLSGKAFSYALEHIDDRLVTRTPHGSFTIRAGNPIERMRSTTLFTKEPETVRWLDTTLGPGSVFYDIGANIGLYSLYALHRFPETIRVVAFEPEAMNLARLNQNIHDNGFSGRILPCGVALGSTTSVVKFRLSRLQAASALHGDSHVTEETQDHIQTVMTMSLDEFRLKAGLDAPTHLKIDVDGPELEVLQGAHETLGHPALKFVLVELDEATYPRANEILTGHGFHLDEKGQSYDGMQNHIYSKPDTV